MHPEISYEPQSDGDADPGEVVWGWVPFEDDPSQGKDRPVLVLARADDELVTLMLSSKDHVGAGHVDEPRAGEEWLDVGSGAWDGAGRPSEVRLDRVIMMAPADVRREGAALDRARFDEVVVAARAVLGW